MKSSRELKDEEAEEEEKGKRREGDGEEKKGRGGRRGGGRGGEEEAGANILILLTFAVFSVLTVWQIKPLAYIDRQLDRVRNHLEDKSPGPMMKKFLD